MLTLLFGLIVGFFVGAYYGHTIIEAVKNWFA